MKQTSHLMLGFARALLILIIGMYLFWKIEEYSLGADKAQQFVWVLAIANFLILFILYRNVFQFKGWKALRGHRKLPKKLSAALLGIALLIFVFVAFQ